MTSLSDRAGIRDARARLAAAVPEHDFQVQVCELLDLLGYKWHHETDSRRSPQGWPDLFAIHPTTGWAIWLELKSAHGTVTSSQLEWLQALGWNDGYKIDPPNRRLVALCRPADFDDLAKLLTDMARDTEG